MVTRGKMRDMLNKVIFFLILSIPNVLNASIVEYELLIEKKSNRNKWEKR